MGRVLFTRWYNTWSQYHFTWHALSVKYRNRNRRNLSRIFVAWAKNAAETCRRVQILRNKCRKSVVADMWKEWCLSLSEASHFTTILQKAGQRLTAMQSAVAFSTWRLKAEEERENRCKIRKVLRVLGYMHLENALASWKKLVARKRRAEQGVKKSNLSALKVLMKSTHSCTKQWRAFTKFKKQQRQRVTIGLLRFVGKAFRGWKPLRGSREEKELHQSVVCYKYALRRCKVMLRLLQRYTRKAAHLRKTLEIMLKDGTIIAKAQISEWWRREARGTRLYKRRFCKHLLKKVVRCWLDRFLMQKQVRKTMAKLAKPRQRRMKLWAFTEWKLYSVETRVQKQKVSRHLHQMGRRDEEQFLLAWLEWVQNRIRRHARLRKGLSNLLAKQFWCYHKAVHVSRRQFAAANLLLNFGEDRCLTSSMREWHGVVLSKIRTRVLVAFR